MKGYWDQLRPLEKRLVVGVAAVLFIILNAAFVVPYFSEWERVKVRMAKAQQTLNMFQTNITQKPRIQAEVIKLEGEGPPVKTEDQSSELERTILTQATTLGIVPGPSGKITSRPTQFFVELSKNLSVPQCKEQQLIDFLYNLGAGNSLIRVRGLTLKAVEPAHEQLNASVTLVTSYQKNPAGRTTAAPTTAKGPAPAPGIKPTSVTSSATNKASSPAKSGASSTKPPGPGGSGPPPKPVSSKQP